MALKRKLVIVLFLAALVPSALGLELCVDTDSGDRPYRGGHVLTLRSARADRCADATTIIEWECMRGAAVERAYKCAYGCETVEFFEQEVPWRAAQCIHGCGNGVLDIGEQCDDANLRSGDGCSMLCTSEPLDARPEFSSAAVILGVAALMGLALLWPKK